MCSAFSSRQNAPSLTTLPYKWITYVQQTPKQLTIQNSIISEINCAHQMKKAEIKSERAYSKSRIEVNKFNIILFYCVYCVHLHSKLVQSERTPEINDDEWHPKIKKRVCACCILVKIMKIKCDNIVFECFVCLFVVVVAAFFMIILCRFCVSLIVHSRLVIVFVQCAYHLVDR